MLRMVKRPWSLKSRRLSREGSGAIDCALRESWGMKEVNSSRKSAMPAEILRLDRRRMGGGGWRRAFSNTFKDL